MKIVTADQMVALEQASESLGTSADTLMENAGLAVAVAAREAMGTAAGARVLILVGPGNNGADGLVVARHLQRWGAEALAYLVSHRPLHDPKMELAQSYGVTILHSSEDAGFHYLDRALSRSLMVIDAVLGTGQARPIDGITKDIILRVNTSRTGAHRQLVLALDLPTGVNPDTGQTDSASLTADITVALGFPKIGLLTFPGVEHVGELRVVDIGLQYGLSEEQGIDLELITGDWVSNNLPPRPLNSHKGTFGHVLVVAGSRNYVGAAYLVSQAAVRIGAGLVTLATPESVYPILAGKLTEIIHLPLPEDEGGRVHPDAAAVIRNNLGSYSALAIGSGLGQSEGTTDFLDQLLLQSTSMTLPTVIDADGLNNLSRLSTWWKRLGGPTVLTPHPGEMATLTGSPTSDIQGDRLNTVRRWSAEWNVSVGLKGAHTAISDPSGLVRLARFANPGLASGGTGDVLTGVIGGLMAQGLSPYLAACCGAYLHGSAGEQVRAYMGHTGMIASDLLDVLPHVIMGLRG